MSKRKLPSRVSGRPVLPTGVDVRPIPIAPGYLAAQDGSIYSDTDPPLLMAVREHRAYSGAKAMRQRVRLAVNGRLSEHYVAALVLEAWVGPRPEGAVANYYDGDTLNRRVDNLFWGYPQSRIDPTDFVRVWQSSHSIVEVAERIGKSRPTCYIVGKRLRDHGVPLKTIETQHLGDADYAALAKLASELGESQ